VIRVLHFLSVIFLNLYLLNVRLLLVSFIHFSWLWNFYSSSVKARIFSKLWIHPRRTRMSLKMLELKTNCRQASSRTPATTNWSIPFFVRVMSFVVIFNFNIAGIYLGYILIMYNFLVKYKHMLVEYKLNSYALDPHINTLYVI